MNLFVLGSEATQIVCAQNTYLLSLFCFFRGNRTLQQQRNGYENHLPPSELLSLSLFPTQTAAHPEQFLLKIHRTNSHQNRRKKVLLYKK